MDAATYEETLKLTRRKLTGGFISARALAKYFGISKQAAYSRITALKKLGCTFKEKRARDKGSKVGPLSVLYKVVGGTRL